MITLSVSLKDEIAAFILQNQHPDVCESHVLPSTQNMIFIPNYRLSEVIMKTLDDKLQICIDPTDLNKVINPKTIVKEVDAQIGNTNKCTKLDTRHTATGTWS